MIYVYMKNDGSKIVAKEDFINSLSKPNDYIKIEEYITEQEETLEELQVKALKKVVQSYSAQYDESLEMYSSNEQATFPSQESEARAWSLDNTTPTPTIDNLATARGINRLILISKVLDNLNSRDIATGQQQAVEDSIKACTTIAELEALGY